jgi:signal transduction histidine kinase
VNHPTVNRDPASIERFFLQSEDLASIDVSADGVVVGWRGAAARLFGLSEAEALGQPFAVVFTKRDDVFWGSAIVQAAEDASGAHLGFSLLVQDPGELRRKVDDAQALPGPALRTIAHDLRTPLGAMSNALYLLGKSSDEAIKTKATDVLGRQIGVMKTLVDELSSMAQAQDQAHGEIDGSRSDA